MKQSLPFSIIFLLFMTPVFAQVTDNPDTDFFIAALLILIIIGLVMFAFVKSMKDIKKGKILSDNPRDTAVDKHIVNQIPQKQVIVISNPDDPLKESPRNMLVIKRRLESAINVNNETMIFLAENVNQLTSDSRSAKRLESYRKCLDAVKQIGVNLSAVDPHLTRIEEVTRNQSSRNKTIMQERLAIISLLSPLEKTIVSCLDSIEFDRRHYKTEVLYRYLSDIHDMLWELYSLIDTRKPI